MTDPLPILSSVRTVVVALAVNVADPVLLTFPAMVLFNARDIILKCTDWSGTDSGTVL